MSKPKKSTAAKAESAPKKKWKVWGSTLVHVVKIVEADTAEDVVAYAHGRTVREALGLGKAGK